MTEELTALERRAKALHEQGDTGDEALEVNAEILALDPMNAAATNRLGVALSRRGQLVGRARRLPGRARGQHGQHDRG